MPPSNAFILKSLICLSTNATTTQLITSIATGDATISVYLEDLQLAQIVPHVWSGWTVLNAGDTVKIYTSQTGLFYWVAGAVLPYAAGLA